MAWLVGNLVVSIISYPVFLLTMGLLTIILTIVMLAFFLITFLLQEDKLNPLLLLILSGIQ